MYESINVGITYTAEKTCSIRRPNSKKTNLINKTVFLIYASGNIVVIIEKRHTKRALPLVRTP